MELLRERLKTKVEASLEVENALSKHDHGNEDITEEEMITIKSLGTSTLKLPQFHTSVQARNDSMKARVNEVARELLLINKSRLLVSQDELTEFYISLDRNATPPHSADQKRDKYIGYNDYKKLVMSLRPELQKWLTAATFMKLLTDDPHGRVSIVLLFNYIMRKIWLIQTRIGLAIYDEGGLGFLKDQGLESYVTELIPSLAQLGGMDSSFVSFYVCTAVRKFFFFLDPNKTGAIKILDILCSGLIDDLLDLRDPTPPDPSNWFSYENTMRIYGQYLNLDRDHNGMLSKSELLRYSETTMTLTPTFIDRVFQECLTFSGEMDYKTFVEFVLALENCGDVQALQYFFRILDIDHKGYLDAFTLHYFYKDILKCMEEHGSEKIPFDDVKDEIFDMVKPKDPYKITLPDLKHSGKGPTVVSILTDFLGFWAYETRESLPNDKREQQQQFSKSSAV